MWTGKFTLHDAYTSISTHVSIGNIQVAGILPWVWFSSLHGMLATNVIQLIT